MNVPLDNTLLGCSGEMQGKPTRAQKLSVVLPILVASLVAGIAGDARSEPNRAPIDCAILLCMGGGFPANPVCNAAKAEVVRRITPNPQSEPPLQIWNCPMAASLSAPAGSSPVVRLIHGVGKDWPLEGMSNAEPMLVVGEALNTETLAFLRTIRVYNVMHYSQTKQGRDEQCSERWSMQLGGYDTIGHYSWSGLHPSAVPAWVGLNRSCNPANSYRGVAFEWTDYAGQHGTEVVRY